MNMNAKTNTGGGGTNNLAALHAMKLLGEHGGNGGAKAGDLKLKLAGLFNSSVGGNGGLDMKIPGLIDDAGIDVSGRIPGTVGAGLHPADQVVTAKETGAAENTDAGVGYDVNQGLVDKRNVAVGEFEKATKVTGAANGMGGVVIKAGDVFDDTKNWAKRQADAFFAGAALGFDFNLAPGTFQS